MERLYDVEAANDKLYRVLHALERVLSVFRLIHKTVARLVISRPRVTDRTPQAAANQR